MSQPSWAPKRKSGESSESYKKRYYTAQRENAEKSGDTAMTEKIYGKLDKDLAMRSSKTSKGYDLPRYERIRSMQMGNIPASQSAEEVSKQARTGGQKSLKDYFGG